MINFGFGSSTTGSLAFYIEIKIFFYFEIELYCYTMLYLYHVFFMIKDCLIKSLVHKVLPKVSKMSSTFYTASWYAGDGSSVQSAHVCMKKCPYKFVLNLKTVSIYTTAFILNLKIVWIIYTYAFNNSNNTNHSTRACTIFWATILYKCHALYSLTRTLAIMKSTKKNLKCA